MLNGVRKITFVCHGNVCRSPMAEFVFKDMAARRGLNIAADSAATTDEEIGLGVGNPVYPDARRVLLKHGIDPAGKRAVQLTPGDYGRSDLFVCMDDENIRDARRIFGGDPEGKVVRLLDFTPRGGEIDDPWYTGKFEEAYEEIVFGLEALVAALEKEAKTQA